MAGAHAELSTSIGGVQAMAAMLRHVRLDRELSQRQLASRIQRPVDFVVRVEAGKLAEPSIATAALLACACEVSVSLFAVSFALPQDDPLPWPREHQHPQHGPTPGARAMGATLRDLRLRRGWTQLELAGHIGMHRNYLAAMERGATKKPLLLTVTRIGYSFATATPARMAYVTRLAQSFAGEIPSPPLRRERAVKRG